ncbi:MAG: hypothetical protein ABW106_01945 [Steroidobacteraceae bacterium]
MNKLSIVAALTAGLLLQSSVFAGANTNTSTTVGSNFGYGALKDARNNSGSTENVSCYLGAYVSTYTSSTTSNYIQCSATAANGASYYCYTYNPSPAWLALVSSLNESSWIYFYGDASHHCMGINSQQGSSYL